MHSGLRIFGANVPRYTERDMQTIHQPLDFCGANIYNGTVVRAGNDGNPERVASVPGHPQTHFNWKVRPTALYWGPRFLFERYQKPIVVTENGMTNPDWVSLDGKVHDPQRIDFLQRHIAEFGRSMADGVDGLGYFVWSFMDNFEWIEGYKQRFGLVHVDFETQKRTLKDSAYWYRELIRRNGALP